MERIAVLNLKGGVGKTTTAVSLAYIIARDYGKHVLLVDCDMQGNASKALGWYSPDEEGTHSIMLQEAEPVACTRHAYYSGIREPGSSLNIIPANMHLMRANAEVMKDTENEQLHRLSSAIEQLEKMKWYDLVIFDCALGLDMTVLNALIASDMVIAPVPFGGYELDGIMQLQEQLEDLEEIKPDLKLKALFTMKQGNKANREFEEWLRTQAPFEAFGTPVRRSITVQKADLEGVPLPYFSKNCIVAKDYENVAAELMQDLEKIREGRE